MGVKYKRPLKQGDIFVQKYVSGKPGEVCVRYMCLTEGKRSRRAYCPKNLPFTQFQFECLVLYSQVYYVVPNTKVKLWIGSQDMLNAWSYTLEQAL